MNASADLYHIDSFAFHCFIHEAPRISQLAVHTSWSTVPSVWGVSVEKKEVGGRRARQDHRTEPKSIHKWSTPMKRTENKPLKKQDFLKLIAYTCTCVYVYFTNSQSQCKMRLHETCKLLRFRENVAGSVLLSE